MDAAIIIKRVADGVYQANSDGRTVCALCGEYQHGEEMNKHGCETIIARQLISKRTNDSHALRIARNEAMNSYVD